MHRKENIPVDTSKGYEPNDLPIKGVTYGVIGFFIFTAVSGVLGLVFLMVVPGGGLGARELPERRVVPKEPAPIVQNNVTAVTDMWNLRAIEKQQMEGAPEWVNKDKGIVRIPIDRAIDIAAERSGIAAQPANEGEPTIDSRDMSSAADATNTGPAAGGGH